MIEPMHFGSWLEAARWVVENSTAYTFNGVLLDLFSASLMVQIHDGLGETNATRFRAMPLIEAHHLAFQMADRLATR